MKFDATSAIMKAVCCLLLSIVAAAGCSRRPAMYQVSGVVQNADGTIPQGGVRLVRFEPLPETPAETRRVATGEIKDDGTFQLMTKLPGDGVHPAKYKVTFTVWKGPRDPVSLIPEKYTAASLTPFEITVDADMNDCRFVLDPLAGGGASGSQTPPASAASETAK